MLKNPELYKTLTILCVEDDESIRHMYKEMFSLIFKNVYLASDGIEGYEIFQKEQIDIILTDQSMPQMSGLQMSQKIREIDGTIPIIMITAFENLEILRKAIDIQITGFIKKPLSFKSIFSTLEFIAKSVIAQRLLLKEQSRQIAYSSYQEKLTYQKETTIIKNDFLKDGIITDFVCKFLFKPRDILSGDSYSIRRLSLDKSLCFIIDGMGKGISASVTAMMCCAYVNHLINLNCTTSLTQIIKELICFISDNLLEEEIISATFLLFDKDKGIMEYAMFSMPAMLYMNKDSDTVLKLKSNNPPLTSYTKRVNSSILQTQNIEKLILYSDGLSENTLKDNSGLYESKLIDDFKKANSLEELEEKRLQSINTQEDDVTYIFFKKVNSV